MPLTGWHGAGSLDEADALLRAHPMLADTNLAVAVLLGDEATVRTMLAANPEAATAKDGPRGWDPLTYLCFSRYLRLAAERSAGFLRIAEVLLDHGADPNTGFVDPQHQEIERVLYGAAGVAHHAALTRLLLARGADPNDGETAYHAPETLDNGVIEALVGSGKLTDASLTTMLHRKLDWRDYDGVVWLLEHGADPNYLTAWGRRALHHALGRTSPPGYLERLMDHGADPSLLTRDGTTAHAIAARMGQVEALELFERRGFPARLGGDDVFFAACARADEPAARAIAAAEPGLVARLQAADPALLADFAGAGNTAGVRLMLDLGFDIASRTDRGGAVGDTALHVAVWRNRLDTVKLLLARGAPVEAVNGRGETPLSWAVAALVEQSDWTPHKSPEIVVALLAAGASVETVKRFPSGSAADDLLRKHGRR